MRLIRIYAVLLAMSMRRQVTFRSDLIFELIATVLTVAISLFAVLILFTHTDSLGGYTVSEVIMLVGTFHIVTGFRRTFVEPNLRFNAEQVRDGSFDGLLLQPAPTVFLASLGTVAPLALAQSVLGVVMVIISASSSTDSISPGQIVSWAVMVASAAVVMWATRCLVASLVFWVLGLQLDVVYDGIWQAGLYPTTIFAQPFRWLFSYILPVAFIATFPTAVLTGHLPVLWSVSGPIAATVMTAAAIFTWRLGLARYSSATS